MPEAALWETRSHLWRELVMKGRGWIALVVVTAALCSPALVSAASLETFAPFAAREGLPIERELAALRHQLRLADRLL